MSLSKERREILKQECEREPSVEVNYDELRALLDLADERDGYRALLKDIVDRHGETVCTDCECEVVKSGCLGDALHNEILKARTALEGKHE